MSTHCGTYVQGSAVAGTSAPSKRTGKFHGSREIVIIPCSGRVSGRTWAHGQNTVPSSRTAIATPAHRAKVAARRGGERWRAAIVSPRRAIARYASRTRAPDRTLTARPMASVRGTASRHPRCGYPGSRRIR